MIMSGSEVVKMPSSTNTFGNCVYRVQRGSVLDIPSICVSASMQTKRTVLPHKMAALETKLRVTVDTLSFVVGLICSEVYASQ